MKLSSMYDAYEPMHKEKPMGHIVQFKQANGFDIRQYADRAVEEALEARNSGDVDELLRIHNDVCSIETNSESSSILSQLAADIRDWISDISEELDEIDDDKAVALA